MADKISASIRYSGPDSYSWLSALACVVFTGCATAPANPDALVISPEPDRAIVIGWGNTAAEKARAALTTTPGARVSSLFVARANEQKFGFGTNIARLAPGDYALTVFCELYIDYRIFPQDTALKAALSANRVYRLRAEPEGRRCQPTLEDVTGQEK
ncbi:MAG: hypothetical protein K8S22_16765 [Betaproteobacteria bacterium]|nr:hypothetical protein [Betaproteobacteria bacterium]